MTRPYGVGILVPDVARVDVVAVAIGALSMVLMFRFRFSAMRTLGSCAVLRLLATVLR